MNIVFSKFSVLFPLTLLIAAILIILGKVFGLNAMVMIGAILGFLELIIGFFMLARNTDIIKDQSSLEANTPYSLAKTQLAYWTILIVIAYVFIWIVTGMLAPLEGSTLVLLGISIGTTTAAKIIDVSQDEKNRHQNVPSEGFFKDILSDDKGISIHRFQMLVWTVVLGIIFIEKVFSEGQILQFDKELLALLGISNGTYVGLKIPENASSSA